MQEVELRLCLDIKNVRRVLPESLVEQSQRGFPFSEQGMAGCELDNGIGTATGPTHIQEWVTLGPDGNHFTGRFRLNAYDLSNNVVAAFTGTLSGTRITTSTVEQDLVGN